METVFISIFETKKGPSIVEAYTTRDQAEREQCLGATIQETEALAIRECGQVKVDSQDGYTQWVDLIGAD